MRSYHAVSLTIHGACVFSGTPISRRTICTGGCQRVCVLSSWLPSKRYCIRTGRYTALVYASQAGTEFDEGGETIFVDSAVVTDAEESEKQLEVQRGLAVSPRHGRVVVFSGGLENVHGRLPISKGVRWLVQIWFRCADADEYTVPTADRLKEEF